jgi:hypothetical protein
VIIALAVAGLGWIACRAAIEDHYLRRARSQPTYSHGQIEYLKKAAQVEPNNFETTYAIGECYRTKSGIGGEGYGDLARQAMEWYRRGMKLNPHDAYNWLRYGDCLDWIAQPGGEDSQPYFDRANALDPNGMWTTLSTGLHYGAKGDYAAQRTWIERSRRFEWVLNTAADRYLPIVERRMTEDAKGLDLSRQGQFPDTQAPWKPEDRKRSE